ncbi:site-specific integrase [Candidatus Igneacidithiobacillus taiwanensis]|nr:site-specific integrase [Candidatus Igneacidithiobacillus taiwanensis]
MERGIFIQRTESERTILSDVLDRYAREVLPNQKGGDREMSRIRALKSGLGQYSLAALSPAIVAKYRDNRLSTISLSTGRLVGPQTVKHELSLLQRVLKKASMEWGIGLPGGIPTATVAKPKLPRARDRRLVGDEEKRLLEACAVSNAFWLLPLVTLAIETAMRASELLSLTWSRIDLEGRVATLPETKNGDLRRVPLSRRAIEVLQTMPRGINDKPFPISYRSLSKSFLSACDRAGIKDLHFHDLRHEATSRLFEKGLNPMQVAAITGHKTLQMLKRYTHLRAEDLARLLD